MTALHAAIVTGLVLVVSNIFGVLYSMVVLKTRVLIPFAIQSDKSYQKKVFSKRIGLFLLNFFILLTLSSTSVYFFFDLFDPEIPAWWIILVQVFIAFVVDDIWFYFIHRLMHENKFLLKNIHAIHHRSTKPFPLEYLYAHPLEWMMGLAGSILAFAVIFVFMPVSIYSFWIFGVLRNLHEIQIHSDIEIPFLCKLPFVSKTRNHDDHHSKLTGNYASTFTWMDRIFNTKF
jgi:sterol desaturase/sphingolipid hydroxylase (fatty acid hydroxylase superfamily)